MIVSTVIALTYLQKIIIVISLVSMQYILAMWAFIKISKLALPFKKFLIWDFVIILVVYAGAIAAVIYAKKQTDKKNKDISQGIKQIEKPITENEKIESENDKN